MNYSLILIMLLASRATFGQYAIDSISLDTDFTSWYDGQIGLPNTVLQQGELASLGRKSPNSHPYFDKSSWQKASITINRQTFENVDVLYNIEEDVLLIANNLGGSFTNTPIKIRKDIITHFQIGDSHFEYIAEPLGWHEKKFYKVAYRGESISLLGRVYKRLDLKDRQLTYEQHHHYFLEKDNNYHRIKRISTLLKLFPEHKKEIRQYRKQLSFRDLDKPSNESKLAQLVAFCDKL